VDLEDPSALLNGRYLVIFFALESCTAVNIRKGMSTKVVVCLIQEELHPLHGGWKSIPLVYWSKNN
jgi:hypothetical protein